MGYGEVAPFLIFLEKIKRPVLAAFPAAAQVLLGQPATQFRRIYRNSSWMSLRLSHHFVVDWKPPCLMPYAEQPVYPFGACGVEPMFEYEKQM